MNNLWPWRNLLASVCIARLPTGPSFSLSLSLSRKEKIRTNHKTAESPSLKHIYPYAFCNQLILIHPTAFRKIYFPHGSILDNENISVKRRKLGKTMGEFLILRVLFVNFQSCSFPEMIRLNLKKILNLNT